MKAQKINVEALAAHISEQRNITEDVSKDILETLLSKMKEELLNGNEIHLRGLGVILTRRTRTRFYNINKQEMQPCSRISLYLNTSDIFAAKLTENAREREFDAANTVQG